MMPLSCEEVNGFIVAYLDEELPPKTREQFEKHVRRCPACSAYFEQYRTTLALVHETHEVPTPPPELVDLTLAFLERRLNGSSGAPG